MPAPLRRSYTCVSHCAGTLAINDASVAAWFHEKKAEFVEEVPDAAHAPPSLS